MLIHRHYHENISSVLIISRKVLCLEEIEDAGDYLIFIECLKLTVILLYLHYFIRYAVVTFSQHTLICSLNG